ncbi:MAG: BCAM0308 family protein [Proteobacteria bacterium]|nr:BCAM0308 family protein [Pseudomonadota bacterium]
MAKNFQAKDRRDIKHLDRGNPYFEYRKYPEPTECKNCGLVFVDGRWAVKTISKGIANKEICPACRIIKDKIPFGICVLEGNFLKDEKNKSEIINIIKNIEKNVREKRPLQRIMEIKEEDGKLEITTTYDHLARRIGESIYKAYKGELVLKYQEGERFARVYWKRD